MLASLNHPNIAAIHGLEESEELIRLSHEFGDVFRDSQATRATRGPHFSKRIDDVQTIACELPSKGGPGSGRMRRVTPATS